MIINSVKRIISGKEAQNAIWLIGGKVAQMILSFVVTILTARYLGPSNYGLIDYASTYMSFFTAISNLGLNFIIVKEFIDNPKDQGKAIGTTIGLRFLSSTLSMLTIILIVSLVDRGETQTIVVAALCSLSLVFQIFDVFSYWFQAQYKSKIIAIVSFCGYLAVSLYKITLLLTGKSVEWFASATAVDYLVISVLYYICYKKHRGPKIQFSRDKASLLLRQSYHFILSGAMVVVYSQIDKIMLKHMLDTSEVGYYSAASQISMCWVFVLQAIVDAMYPTIMRLAKADKIAFNRKNKQLYAIVFYSASAMALLFTIFGDVVVKVLYGEAYWSAVGSLRIIVWYIAFSYLGVARNAWLVSEGKQKYLKYVYAGAVVINIFLNALFIPIMKAEGAALASLITKLFTSIGLSLMIKELRPNALLMLDAIRLKDVFHK